MGNFPVRIHYSKTDRSKFYDTILFQGPKLAQTVHRDVNYRSHYYCGPDPNNKLTATYLIHKIPERVQKCGFEESYSEVSRILKSTRLSRCEGGSLSPVNFRNANML